MTKETLQKGNDIRSDIGLLELRIKEIKQFYNVFKNKHPSEEQLSNFCNNMIEITKTLKEIKEKQFEEL